MVKTKNPLVNKISNNLKLGDLRAKRSGVNFGECKKRTFIKNDISFKKVQYSEWTTLNFFQTFRLLDPSKFVSRIKIGFLLMEDKS